MSNRRLFLVIVGAIAIVAILRNVQLGGGGDAASRTVTYKVEGSAQQADITYETPSGSSQQTQVDVPVVRAADHAEGLTYQFSPGTYLYISAQNVGDVGGSITCIIEENGKVLTTNTSFGMGAITQCTAKS